MTYVARKTSFSDLDSAVSAAHAHVCDRHRGGRLVVQRVIDAAGRLVATVSLGRATAQEAGKAEARVLKLFNRRFGG